MAAEKRSHGLRPQIADMRIGRAICNCIHAPRLQKGRPIRGMQLRMSVGPRIAATPERNAKNSNAAAVLAAAFSSSKTKADPLFGGARPAHRMLQECKSAPGGWKTSRITLLEHCKSTLCGRGADAQAPLLPRLRRQIA
jgi:hypothetical protein